MGVTASFVVVPANLFNAEQTNLQPDAEIPESAKHFHIDKAWFVFHEILKDMAAPLRFAILGENPEVFEEEEITDLIYISPTRVKGIAAALGGLSEIAFMGALKDKGLLYDSDGEYEREHFKALKEAYRVAAAENSGLGIGIG